MSDDFGLTGIADDTFRRMASQTVRELTDALTEAQATIARLEAERAELAFTGWTQHGWTQHDVLVNHEGAYQAIRTMAGRLAALSPGHGAPWRWELHRPQCRGGEAVYV